MMVKKYMIGLYVNNGTHASPEWVRIKKSTSLEISMNPETEDRDYIADVNATTEVMRYKPSLNQPITMYKGEDDYEFAFPRFFNMGTGTDAKCEVMVIFMQESGEHTLPAEVGADPVTVTAYKAWQNEATLSFASLNGVDSTITMDINFGGTIAKGVAYPDETTKKPVFVEDTSADSGWVDPFEA